MKKVSRHLAKTCAVVLCMQTILTGCGQTQEVVQEEIAVVTVDMQTAEKGALTLSNSFIGTISPQETVYVIPMVAGTVTQANYEVGDTVNAGDLLFKIDDSQAQLQYQQAALSAEQAQLSAESTLGTQQDASNLSIESSLTQAKSGYESAQIGLKAAKDAYDSAKSAVDEAQKIYDAAVAAQAASGYPQGSVSANDLQRNVSSAAASLAQAKAARSSAEISYLNAQSGYRTAEKAVETAEASAEIQQGAALDDTEAQIGVQVGLADVGVDSAALALSYYTVTAPVSGVIESKSIKVNDIASQQNPAYTIVNNDSMTVTFNVSEAVKNTLSLGQNITLERSGNTYEASITEIGASVNQQTGLFQIKALVMVTGNELPSGVSVTVKADTYSAQDQILIPYDAVYYENDGAYVYTSVDGVAVKTPVVTGIFNEDTIAVESGLNVGDTVITSWSPKLTDGVQVAPISSAGATDASETDVSQESESEEQ